MRTSGFSLVEVLVAMALALVLIVGTAEMLTLALRSKDRGDLTSDLTHALTDRLESLRALPFDDPALAPGEHAVTGPVPPGGRDIVQEWAVSEDGGRMKLVRLTVRASGRTGPGVSAVLFLSRDLGFAP